VGQRKTMILIGAIAIGAIAAFVLLNYVRGVEDRSKVNPVDAYVIQADISRGASGNDAKAVIVKKRISGEFKPGTAVNDIAEIENKVASTNLVANQVLVQGMFIDKVTAKKAFADNLSDRLEDKNNVAFSFSVDQTRAVAGNIKPGDYVNILVNVADVNAAAVDAATLAKGPNFTPYAKPARVVYQKVKVLAIGTELVPVPGAPLANDSSAKANQAQSGNAGVITFEVPLDAALRLASVDPTKVYLTLVPSDWKPTPVKPLDNGDYTGLLPGEDPSRLTPYGPTGFKTSTVTGSAAPTTTR